MTRTRKIALGFTLAASALAGAAYAGQTAKGDGELTRAEAQTRAQDMFARMDVNKDGKVDQADRAARHAAMFDRMDTDKNGQISRAEFDAMHQPGHRGDQAGAHRGDGHGPGMDHGGMHDRGHHRGGMMMGRMADANKDGAVSQAEFTQAALQRFDQADANKDGKVTRDERQAAHRAMREHWQHRMGEPAAPATPGK